MICPRCTVAEISAETQTCVLCGYSPGGVTLDVGTELDEIAHRELGTQYHLDAILSQTPGWIRYAAREIGSDRHAELHVFGRHPAGPDTARDDRFRRDVEAAAALAHPHIVPVFGGGVTPALRWCAQPAHDGPTLADLLAQRGQLDLRACLRITEHVGAGLQHAHGRGVVHGAVGAANIRMTGTDAAIGGFVTGRLLEAFARGGGARTHGSTPPEGATPGESGAAGDQYALAVTVHECLHGAPPALDAGGGAAALTPPATDVPLHVTAALRRALEADPARRFPSVAEFVAALSARPAPAAPPLLGIPAASPEPRATQRLLRVDQYPNPNARRRVLLAVAVIVGLYLIYELWQPDRRPPVTPTVVIPGPRSTPTPPPAAAAPTPTRRAPPSGTAPRTTTPPATSPAPPPVGAAEPGQLFINATPWGEVFVDDQPVGTTPLAGLDIAPGDHHIRVVREGHRPFEQVVTVAPGQRVRLTNIVLEVERP